MNKDERAALTALLDNVGLGYTKHQAETKLLRAYLQRTQPKVAHKAKMKPVVITVSLATCAQAPVPIKAPVAKESTIDDRRVVSLRIIRGPAKKAKAKR